MHDNALVPRGYLLDTSTERKAVRPFDGMIHLQQSSATRQGVAISGSDESTGRTVTDMEIWMRPALRHANRDPRPQTRDSDPGGDSILTRKHPEFGLDKKQLC